MSTKGHTDLTQSVWTTVVRETLKVSEKSWRVGDIGFEKAQKCRVSRPSEQQQKQLRQKSQKKPQTERRTAVEERRRLNDSELMQRKENQTRQRENWTPASMILSMTQAGGWGWGWGVVFYVIPVKSGRPPIVFFLVWKTSCRPASYTATSVFQTLIVWPQTPHIASARFQTSDFMKWLPQILYAHFKWWKSDGHPVFTSHCNRNDEDHCRRCCGGFMGQIYQFGTFLVSNIFKKFVDVQFCSPVVKLLFGFRNVITKLNGLNFLWILR